MTERQFTCRTCRQEWMVPYGTGRPRECTICGSPAIERSAGDSGKVGRGCFRYRRGRRLA